MDGFARRRKIRRLATRLHQFNVSAAKGIEMPFINGRFYANPIYGRAVERVRRVKEGEVWTENESEDTGRATRNRRATPPQSRDKGQKPHDRPTYENPQNEEEARLANVVHNETSSLRQDSKNSRDGSGTADKLQQARIAIAEVANRVMKSGHPEWVAPSELSSKEARALAAGNPDAVRAHNASLSAARQALAGSNMTDGATQYRLRWHSGNQSPVSGKPVTSHFGPFQDSLGKTRTIVVAP